MDILRGLPLLGVLLVNLLTLFRVSLFAHITGADVPADAAVRIVLALVDMFLQFKAFRLFSFLLGAGVAVQVNRAPSRSDATRFLLRRFLVLLGIGLIHLLLIWNGDILTLDAVCVLLLIPMLRLSTVWLALVHGSQQNPQSPHSTPGHRLIARDSGLSSSVMRFRTLHANSCSTA